MRLPREWYQMEQAIAQHLPELRPAQQRGLTLWVYGAILAQSACQNAVIAALLAVGPWHSLRQHLREWLYDGQDKAAPCQTQLDVPPCFAPLLKWLLSWWQGPQLALAIDATLHGDRVAALVVSVLYRGSAIPVAWQILPANKKAPWLPSILTLLQLLAPVVPQSMKVLVLADRGLWSPRLWQQIQALGWHPLLRVKNNTSFQPLGACRLPAQRLVPGAGHAWVGQGTVFRRPKAHRFGTLLVVWGEAQVEPWMVLTDLAPTAIGVCWYGLRVWVELGFRALKGIGWQWQHTRRSDPTRVTRHWLVLAVAMLWVMAYGTRGEDAAAQGLPPGRLRMPQPVSHQGRKVSVFRQGLSWLQHQLGRGRLWRRLWLVPEPWPTPAAGLQITYGRS
ncbi:MAG: transposase [Chloroflexi bacterium]|nr:transposase [Chloroflexota bacterium]